MTDHLSSLSVPSAPPPIKFADWIEDEITKATLRRGAKLGEMRELQKRKPKGYTAKVAKLDKDASASLGRRVVLEEIKDMLAHGRMTLA